MNKITFAIGLHNHQPVGNFDFVFEEGYRMAYEPFFDVWEKFDNIPVGIHFSGPLLDYIEEKHPELISRMREHIQQKRLEIIGGAYYEPILTMLPERDRQGQIKLYSEHLQSLFGEKPKGMWLAERVWEQNLVKSLADSGVEFVTLDDNHFKYAGLNDDELFGYYLTEDEGRILKVLPISEKLRYYIPFQNPEKTIEFFREIAEKHENVLMVYADDGEKFGLWPYTHKHIYVDGWLRRFFEQLAANRDWIDVVPFSEAVSRFAPLGKVYLPDASYREMTEWALPAKQIMEYEDAVGELKQKNLFERCQRFLKGGIWRNFKSKYPEANLLYAKMMEVSEAVEKISESDDYAEAQKELYRGQCNCPYWHGVFGGLYLPHLRAGVYKYLIGADVAARNADSGKRKNYARYAINDFDFDGHEEIALDNPHHKIYVSPSRGGMIYEHDLKDIKFNLLATLSRKMEAYHRALLAPKKEEQKSDGVASIHDLIVSKEPGLADYLSFDNYQRGSLIDHFYADPPQASEIMAGRQKDLAPLHRAAFMTELGEGRKNYVSLEMATEIKGHNVPNFEHIQFGKALEFSKNDMATHFSYNLRNASTAHQSEFWLAVEFNYALLAGHAHDRYFRKGDGGHAGELDRVAVHDDQKHFSIVDEWLGVEITLNFDRPARVLTHPVFTVSLSESGLEKVFQSAVVMACWKVSLAHGKHNNLDFSQTVRYLKKG